MALQIKHVIIIFLATLIRNNLSNSESIKLPDQISNPQQQQIQQQQQQQSQQLPRNVEGGNRQGKHLLDFVGLGTGPNVDPYIARVNSNCLSGELADCFKSQALGTFEDFFSKDLYNLSPNARIIRMPDYQLRSLQHEPYEYAEEPKSNDSEWDLLVKFAMRKIERFLKSTSFEIAVPDDISEEGRYSPRFIDDITDEIDVLEDKKAPIFKRHRLKKLFIPLLIILKLFKLKLLLFLPLILGLASFKKLLGFFALIIPGVIGYFKICHPQSNFGGGGYSNQQYAQYNTQGLGGANYHQHYTSSGQAPFYKQSAYADPYSNYYRENQPVSPIDHGTLGNNVRFGENERPISQDLAYQGYSEYRNKKPAV